MQNADYFSRPMRSALFVDFDNVFIRLSELDVNIARSFATCPLDWIAWLEKSLPSYGGIETGPKRHILVRRCYLNPKSFGNYRPYFIRGAFETVDCPSLTTQGKTSADVHIVVDLLDLLDHQVHYDEFIIMSADADFTPVLLKLRKWDKRTAILAVGSTSAAYRAASDLVIDQDAFIEEALGGGDAVSYAEPARVIRRPEIIPSGMEAVSSPDSILSPEEQKRNYSRFIVNYVQTSSEAVTMAQLAYKIRQAFPEIGSYWQGKGSFKLFLSELDLGNLATSPVIPGYVYDPERHDAPSGDTGMREEHFETSSQEMAMLARKIHDLTDTPYLSPKHYGVLFTSIAEEINRSGYNMTMISKAVRDRCKEDNIPVARQHVNFVLRGIAFTGHRFGEKSETPRLLADRFLNNTMNLCENAQFFLSKEELDLLKEWLLGGLQQEA